MSPTIVVARAEANAPFDVQSQMPPPKPGVHPGFVTTGNRIQRRQERLAMRGLEAHDPCFAVAGQRSHQHVVDTVHKLDPIAALRADLGELRLTVATAQAEKIVVWVKLHPQAPDTCDKR